MKLHITLLALLGVVILQATADGNLNAVADEDAAELRSLLLKGLEANTDAAESLTANVDDNAMRTLAEEADDDDEDVEDERMLAEEVDDDDEDDENANLNEFAKRATDKNGVKYSRSKCPPNYRFSKFAPRCAKRSKNYIKGDVSSKDARLIVKEHNRLRGQVKPKAANMLKMSWDKDLAVSAQKWAEICRSVHTLNEGAIIPGKFAYGENLARTWPAGKVTGRADWKTTINLWFKEYKDFTYGVGPKHKDAVIGHYTAMVWAKSYRIGCGYAECRLGGSTASYWVCAYGPAGNVEGSINTPYLKASGNRSCGTCRKCRKNLCVCGSRKVCKINQYLNIEKCRCKDRRG